MESNVSRNFFLTVGLKCWCYVPMGAEVLVFADGWCMEVAFAFNWDLGSSGFRSENLE